MVIVKMLERAGPLHFFDPYMDWISLKRKKKCDELRVIYLVIITKANMFPPSTDSSPLPLPPAAPPTNFEEATLKFSTPGKLCSEIIDLEACKETQNPTK